MPYVFSTATAPQAYSEWLDGGADIKTSKLIAVIKGGHGVATRNLLTPKGVATYVTDAQLEALEKNDAFKRHKAKGFMVVDKQEQKPEKIARNMSKKDKSAPLVPEDFTEKKQPIVNKPMGSDGSED